MHLLLTMNQTQKITFDQNLEYNLRLSQIAKAFTIFPVKNPENRQGWAATKTPFSSLTTTPMPINPKLDPTEAFTFNLMQP